MTDTIDKLRDALHDEIDEKEELGETARAVVAKHRERLLDLVDEYGDTMKALEAFAILAEDELDDMTTKAVQRGYAAGKLRPL